MKQIMRHSLLPGAVDSIMVELERGLNESQIRYITHEVFVGLEYLHSLKGWFDLRWRPYFVVSREERLNRQKEQPLYHKRENND